MRHKPHLRKFFGFWWCLSHTVIGAGIGFTPRAAYDDWRHRATTARLLPGEGGETGYL